MSLPISTFALMFNFIPQHPLYDLPTCCLSLISSTHLFHSTCSWGMQILHLINNYVLLHAYFCLLELSAVGLVSWRVFKCPLKSVISSYAALIAIHLLCHKIHRCHTAVHWSWSWQSTERLGHSQTWKRNHHPSMGGLGAGSPANMLLWNTSFGSISS